MKIEEQNHSELTRHALNENERLKLVVQKLENDLKKMKEPSLCRFHM